MNIKLEYTGCSRCGGTGVIYYRDKHGNKSSKKCSKCKGSGGIYIKTKSEE